MMNVNPMQIIAAIRNGANPEQLMLGILEGQMGSTPMGQNLLKMAKEGRTDDIERGARNAVAAQGRDFDAEFNAFKQRLGIR